MGTERVDAKSLGMCGRSTQAGLAAARARGRVGGRPFVMDPKKINTARKLYASQQHTIPKIAKMLGVSTATIYRHLDRVGA